MFSIFRNPVLVCMCSTLSGLIASFLALEQLQDIFSVWIQSTDIVWFLLMFCYRLSNLGAKEPKTFRKNNRIGACCSKSTPSDTKPDCFLSLASVSFRRFSKTGSEIINHWLIRRDVRPAVLVRDRCRRRRRWFTRRHWSSSETGPEVRKDVFCVW